MLAFSFNFLFSVRCLWRDCLPKFAENEYKINRIENCGGRSADSVKRADSKPCIISKPNNNSKSLAGVPGDGRPRDN